MTVPNDANFLSGMESFHIPRSRQRRPRLPMWTKQEETTVESDPEDEQIDWDPSLIKEGACCFCSSTFFHYFNVGLTSYMWS